jgi:O-antigen/teichoic acid export membrane protein
MIRHARKVIGRLRRSVVARNSGWMFLGFGLRVIVQACYFVLIARALGPREYGGFVGATSLISIVVPFSGWGSGYLLVKSVSRDRGTFSEYWGNALFMTAATGVLLFGIIMSLARLLLPNAIPLALVAMVCIADLAASRIVDIAAQSFLAMDQLRYTANLGLLPYVLRLIGAAVVLLVWHHATALCWGWFYLGSTLVSCAVALGVTRSKLGLPKLALWRLRGEFTEGFYFGASLSAQTVYNDIDKAMLARLSTLDATGIYAAAYRLIDVAFTPVRSVMYAAYSNFFRHGHGGMAASYAYAKRLLPKMMAYSALIFVVLLFAAPVIPVILGAEYARTVEALRWLAVLPFFKAIHYFLADALTGAGYQGTRTAMQVFMAILNIGLNFWLIPTYSWRGAAWASLASDGALVVAMYAAVAFMILKESRLSVEFSDSRTCQ